MLFINNVRFVVDALSLELAASSLPSPTSSSSDSDCPDVASPVTSSKFLSPLPLPISPSTGKRKRSSSESESNSHGSSKRFHPSDHHRPLIRHQVAPNPFPVTKSPLKELFKGDSIKFDSVAPGPVVPVVFDETPLEISVSEYDFSPDFSTGKIPFSSSLDPNCSECLYFRHENFNLAMI